jgi:hypothetical protein
LRYPVYVSRKVDGVRGVLYPEGLRSRNGNLFPNVWIQEAVKNLPKSLDMEVEVPGMSMATLNGWLHKKTPAHPGKIKLHVFDVVREDLPYKDRIELAARALGGYGSQLHTTTVEVVCSYPRLCHTEEDVLDEYQKVLDHGYEGIIIRNPLSMYKAGRSTFAEQNLKLVPYKEAIMKIKKFRPRVEIIPYDEVVELQELVGSKNKTINEAGCVECIDDMGRVITAGLAFDRATRCKMWLNRYTMTGDTAIIRYKQRTALGYREPVCVDIVDLVKKQWM